MKRKKKKGILSKLLSKGVILTFQLIASIVFLAYIYSLKMLPLRYYLILVVILLVLFLGEVIWITSGARKKDVQVNTLEFLLVNLQVSYFQYL